ncbi:preprotein translocase subunit YajC [Niveibacterium sp. SC-1]|uniref:preprotein translocase subunit YajC n=1 Tax=Niveibacterium sp. SC-1 TaxID=3135646 RepID=UPI00311EC384
MLISNAYAQTAGAADPTSGIVGLLPLVLMFVVMWFLMIRPQQKKAKEHRALLEALSKGDEIVTSGGIAGKVTQTGETYVKVEIADGVEVQVHKPAISSVLPKGTLKSV